MRQKNKKTDSWYYFIARIVYINENKDTASNVKVKLSLFIMKHHVTGLSSVKYMTVSEA
jgi:hypothetical protein